MCIVSNVTDRFQKQWPDPDYLSKLSGRWITEKDWQEYQRLKANAMELDKFTNQPDCIKPELDAWEKKMKEFLIKQGVLKDNT